MVYNNNLTTTKKDKKVKVILKRDGNFCLYCFKLGKLDQMHFIEGHPQFKRQVDHLNKNEQDHRVENLGVAHAVCNLKRRDGNPEMDFIAKEKLAENLRDADPSSLGESEREGQSPTQRPKLTHELKEPDINVIINKLVWRKLDSELPENSTKELVYSKTLRSIHFLTIKESGGRGSEQAARRSLDAHLSDDAPWEEFYDGQETRMIKRRKPQN